MSRVEPHAVEVFCADRGHLRKGEDEPRRAAIARFERYRPAQPTVVHPNDPVMPEWDWEEIRASSVQLQREAAYWQEPLPRPSLHGPRTPEGRAEYARYAASLPPDGDKPMAGWRGRNEGPPGWHAPLPKWPQRSVDVARYRFECELCDMTVVVTGPKLYKVLDVLADAGVSSISLAALGSRVGKQ